MENGIRVHPVDQLCHFLNGHYGTDLVVDHHNGNEEGVLPQDGFQGVQSDAALAVGLQIGHFKALRFQLLHAV